MIYIKWIDSGVYKAKICDSHSEACKFINELVLNQYEICELTVLF